MKTPTPWLHPGPTKETTAACKAFMQNSKAGVEDAPLVYETIQQALSACCLRAAAHCLAAKTLTSPPLHMVPPLAQSGEGRAVTGCSLQISSTQATLGQQSACKTALAVELSIKFPGHLKQHTVKYRCCDSSMGNNSS